ncbi:PapD-like protein [Fusarium flagelliforme]|uniref:Vesicle-associated membrane protein-associated protein b n=1 Tax=Fusarium flagelliforme TaxID=2675880 RepID=A0A395MK45_9HYPO|nr:PapD-like protein [Fusarium flagelliforme]KAH7193734.1 PapD-like protein [Fusarium flagelliforme]RFN48312.1 vesicle-associated membrane protein-associated protein b [Fusarium flagelliforme]
MSVEIEPFELSFKRPFTTEVSQVLTLRNPNSTPVAFKVKTTAPKQYCVRPNAGRIEAGQSFDVSVLLQAMKQDPAPDARCRDKFLVQSTAITADKEFASHTAVLETADKASLIERKIRVNWLAAGPDGEAHRPMSTPNKAAIANGANDTPDVSRTYSSPVVREESPSSAPPPYHSPQQGSHEEERPRSMQSDMEVKSAISQATASIKETAELTYEELKAKLAQAEQQLVSLKDSGLRQRNVKSDSNDDEKRPLAQTAQAVQQTVEGVPVQMAAILCLVSFLLAYFFF